MSCLFLYIYVYYLCRKNVFIIMAQEQTPMTQEKVYPKYLDWTGLSKFWEKAKQYISTEILALDGTKIPLNVTVQDSPSITNQIEELWKVLGSGSGTGSGNLSQDVSTILGAYIKSFKGVEGEYITIGPTTQTTGAQDVTLTLNENKLKEKFAEITDKSYVNTIKSEDATTDLVQLEFGSEDGGVTAKIIETNLSNRLNALDGHVATATQQWADQALKDQAQDQAISGVKTTADTVAASYVKSLSVTGDDGVSANVSSENNQTPHKGEVSISLDTSPIRNRVGVIETTYTKTVSVEDKKPIADGGNEYVTAEIKNGKNNGDVVIVIDDTKVTDALNRTTDLSSQLFSINNKNFYQDEDKNVVLVAGDILHRQTETSAGNTSIYQEIETVKASQITSIKDDTANNLVKVSFTKNGNEVTPSINVEGLNTQLQTITGLATAIPNSSQIPYSSADTTSVHDKISGLTSDVNTIKGSYVKTFGGKTGEITIDADASAAGAVKFAMNGNELQGTVQGLGSLAYMGATPYTTAQIEGIFVTES